jgi:hypothetical protein
MVLPVAKFLEDQKMSRLLKTSWRGYEEVVVYLKIGNSCHNISGGIAKHNKILSRE